MRTLSVAVCFVAVVLGSFFAAVVGAEDRTKEKELVLQVRAYKVGDLPVFKQDKNYDPAMLMTLIQATVSPNDWEAKGGRSTMAPYPQNASLIISTTLKNHDKIVDLVEGFRKSK